MATKTFEELKQLAIQIRDEKTNKQNTATRIGTQMLEHLDKLEQDYYDKTAADEELKERDEKLIELESKLIKLVGMGTGPEGNTGVTKVGDIFYNTANKVLYECTGYSDGEITSTKTIPFRDGAIYTFNNELYIWTGSDLVKNTDGLYKNIKSRLESENDNISYINSLVKNGRHKEITLETTITENTYIHADGTIDTDGEFSSLYNLLEIKVKAGYILEIKGSVGGRNADIRYLQIYDSNDSLVYYEYNLPSVYIDKTIPIRKDGRVIICYRNNYPISVNGYIEAVNYLYEDDNSLIITSFPNKGNVGLDGIVVESGYYNTGKISVSEGMLVNLETSGSINVLLIAFYDKNDNLLSSIKGEGDTSKTSKYSIVAPQGVSYAIITTHPDLLNKSCYSIKKYVLPYDLIRFENKNFPHRGHVGLDGVVEKESSYYNSGKISIEPLQKVIIGTSGSASTLLIAFYDKNDNLISGISGNNVSDYSVIQKQEIEAPNNTSYCIITAHPNILDKAYYVLKRYTYPGEVINNNYWKGKTICILGTSISYGQYGNTCYGKIAADILGYNLIQTGLPGQAICFKPNGEIDDFGSTCASKQEYIDAGWDIPDTPTGTYSPSSYNNHYRTYENIFKDENCNADLYVFSVAPNCDEDTFVDTDFVDFDFANWKYKDDTDFSEHRNTFFGAVVFIMNELYKKKPDARIAFCIETDRNVTSVLEENGADYYLDKLSEHYYIPIISLWKKWQVTPFNKNYIIAENHPNYLGQTQLGYMFANELLLLA